MTEKEINKVMDCIISSSHGIGRELEDMVYKELEKQIPKKPMITKFDNGAEIINCGKCYMITLITRAADYCPHCGQKIDWSEGK